MGAPPFEFQPAPKISNQPAKKADNRLTLELNCQSEDVKSYRGSKRDGAKGEPHLLLLVPAPSPQRARRASGSRQRPHMCRRPSGAGTFLAFANSLEGKPSKYSLAPMDTARLSSICSPT